MLKVNCALTQNDFFQGDIFRSVCQEFCSGRGMSGGISACIAGGIPGCLAAGLRGGGIQAHTQGGLRGSGLGPHPRGKLRGIWSRPTPKGKVEGDLASGEGVHSGGVSSGGCLL